MSFVEYALKYAELGWSVIPLVPKQKMPLRDFTWKKYQLKKANPDEIIKWWEKTPEANIAIVTGKLSNLYVVDFDGLDAIERFEAQVCKLPETIFQKTGRPEGGKHALFKFPNKGGLTSKPGFLEGVDLKAGGGYIVAPPSVHPSGNRYQWSNINPIKDGLDDLKDMPPEILEFFSNHNGKGFSTKKPLSLDPVQKGERNSTLASLVGKWIYEDMDIKKVYISALEWNSSLTEPLAQKEVETVVKSIFKTDRRNYPEKSCEIEVIPSNESPQLSDKSLDFPFEVMTGAAGHFANVYGSIMESPEQFLFMAYITCLGAVVSPKLTIKSSLNTQPRLFTVLLGESATDRKSTAINVTTKHFNSIVNNFNSCWGIGSAEGLQRLMKKKEDQDPFGTLLIYDELKAFVSKCKIDSSVLLPMVNTLFENNIYENHTKAHSVRIDSGYLSMLGASTLQTYERIYTPSFMAIGFPNRVFLVPGTATSTHPIPEEISEEDQNILRENLKKILINSGDGLTLDFTLDAQEEYECWYKKIRNINSIHAKRLDTYSLRLMILLAVNSSKSEIDIEVVKAAIALCDWQFEVRKQYDPVDADTKVAEMEEKIRRHLKRESLKDYRLKQKVNAHKSGLQIYSLALKNLQGANEIKRNPKDNQWFCIEEQIL
jgi:hypothetical protein